MASIGLVGFYGWGNYGDELFLKVWERSVGHFHVVRQMNDLTKAPYFSPSARKGILEQDAFIIGGGDLIIPTNVSKLYWNRAWLDKPVYIAGVGVPTWVKKEVPEVIEEMKRFFQHPNVRYISVRDDESADWIAQKLRPTVPIEVFPDLVFSLDLPGRATYSADKTLGISVRYQRSENMDYDRVIEACKYAQSKGYHIVKLVLATGETGSRDLDVSQALQIPGASLFHSENIDEISAAIGGLDGLLSMKFHGTVVATSYGVPTVVLSSTTKSQNLYRNIDRMGLLSSRTDPKLEEKIDLLGLRVPDLVRNELRSKAKLGVSLLAERINQDLSSHVI